MILTARCRLHRSSATPQASGPCPEFEQHVPGGEFGIQSHSSVSRAGGRQPELLDAPKSLSTSSDIDLR